MAHQAVTPLENAWALFARRYEGYLPVVAGDSTFICQPALCDAYCCRTMSVSLDDTEIERMAVASGRQPIEFLECEDGVPIELPMLKPYLLARRGSACAMLSSTRSCTEYEGRPDACHLYPFQVLFLDPETGRAVRLDAPQQRAAVERSIAKGLVAGEPVAFLVRHVPCPGFTGEPLAEGAWRALFASIYRRQYGDPTFGENEKQVVA